MASSGAVHRKDSCNRAVGSAEMLFVYLHGEERIANLLAGRCESRNAAGSSAGIMLRDLTTEMQVYP